MDNKEQGGQVIRPRYNQVTLMTQMFNADAKDGSPVRQVLGVTTVIDGALRAFFDDIHREMPELSQDVDVFREILFAGMKEMTQRLEARRTEKDL